MSASSKSAPKIITFGNEKGGTGKSTLGIHLVVGLMDMGYKVGTLDLDSRQGTFTRFFQNRWQTVRNKGYDLKCPVHIPVEKSLLPYKVDRYEEEERNLTETIRILTQAGCDYIVIDTAGSDTNLSRLGHKNADILVTPINDSFIDLDLIAKIDGNDHTILRPSIYADMVWKYRQERAIKGKKPLDWFVVRNRVSHINAKNKKHIRDLLNQLQKRFAFTLIKGMGERVVYRELFLKGLTLLDLKSVPGFKMSVSHVAGRQEIRAILKDIGIEKMTADKTPKKPVADIQKSARVAIEKTTTQDTPKSTDTNNKKSIIPSLIQDNIGFLKKSA